MKRSAQAKAVANYFLEKAEQEGKPITPLQIQKLVYIAYGWYLAIADEQLIDDEYIEAWDYGPVFPSLYLEFRHFGRDQIKGRAKDFELSEDREVIGEFEPSVEDDLDNAEFVKTFLDRIWEIYGDYSGGQLVTLTHAEGTPWDQARKAEEGKKNPQIPDHLIKQHYLQRLDEDD